MTAIGNQFRPAIQANPPAATVDSQAFGTALSRSGRGLPRTRGSSSGGSSAGGSSGGSSSGSYAGSVASSSSGTSRRTAGDAASPPRAATPDAGDGASPLKRLFLSLGGGEDEGPSEAPVKRVRRTPPPVNAAHSFALSSFLESLHDAGELPDHKADVLRGLCDEIASLPQGERIVAFTALIGAAQTLDDDAADLLGHVAENLTANAPDTDDEALHEPRIVSAVFETLCQAALPLAAEQNGKLLPKLVPAADMGLPRHEGQRFGWFTAILNQHTRAALEKAVLPRDLGEMDDDGSADWETDSEASDDDTTMAEAPLAPTAAQHALLATPLPAGLPQIDDAGWVALATNLAQRIPAMSESQRRPAFETLRAAVRVSETLSAALIGAMARAPQSFDHQRHRSSLYS